MRDSLIILVLAFVPVLAVAGDGAGEFEVRGHSWGDSQEDVIEKEGQPDDGDQASETLGYEGGSVADVQCSLRFNFREGELFSFGYVSMETYRNRNRHRGDWNSLNKVLVDKYGEPDRRIRERDDNPYTEWGMELVSGKVLFIDRWRIGETAVTHKITASDGTILHMVSYKHMPTIEEIEESSSEQDRQKL